MNQGAQDRLHRALPVAALALAPWAWFVVRDVHPVLDLVAIVLPLVIVLTILVSVWLAIYHYRRAAILAISLLVFLPVAVMSPRRSSDTGAPSDRYRVMSANLESNWFTDNDFDWYLEKHPASILVVSEMQQSHLNELRERFAHHIDDVIEEEQFREDPADGDPSYKRYGFPSFGVYSEHPLTALEDTTGIEFGMPGIRVQVDLPTGPVVVYALHVPKPAFGSGQYQVSFEQHREIARRLADSISAETLPVAVVGDLNMTDRGGSYRTILGAGVRDAMLNGSPPSTSTKGSWWNLLYLRIDHIMLSDDLCADGERYDLIDFSDHLVISTDIGPCAAR